MGGLPFKMIAKCDLLVSSTDSFLNEALVTISQLKKTGLADLFDCHLLLGEQNPIVSGFTVINRSIKGTWSSELKEALTSLKKPYILLWLDDFTPIDCPSISKIEERINHLIDTSGNYLRLNPTPRAMGHSNQLKLREILPGEAYRTSTICSVWKREVLISLLDEAENAWQFEVNGSYRSDAITGFYASDETLINVINLVIKGYLDPRTFNILESRGILYDSILSRPTLSFLSLTYLRLREIRSIFFKLTPWRVKRTLKKLLQSKY
jgi:hypothetical protein